MYKTFSVTNINGKTLYYAAYDRESASRKAYSEAGCYGLITIREADVPMDQLLIPALLSMEDQRSVAQRNLLVSSPLI